jgi:hypothetical protein
MAIQFVGIDLAKTVSAVQHGVDEAVKRALVRPAVARQAARTRCDLAAVNGGHGSLVGRPPLGTALAAHGHTVRPIAPKFVARLHVAV